MTSPFPINLWASVNHTAAKAKHPSNGMRSEVFAAGPAQSVQCSLCRNPAGS